MSRRFFRSVWRFNGLLIALVSSLALLWLLVISAWFVIDWIGPRVAQQVLPVTEERTGDVPNEREEIAESASGFSELGDTGLLYSPIYRDALVVRGGLRASTGYKSTNSEVDWLIYDPTETDPDLASWRLLQRDPALLIDARLLSDEDSKPAKALAVFVRYVTEDGNDDGLLTGSDPIRYALASARGRALTDLDLAGDFVSLTLLSDREAVLVLDQGRSLLFAHLDLNSRSVLRTVSAPLGAKPVDN